MKQLIAFVTGGTGFVGSHLVAELMRRGYSIRCLVRPSSDKIWLKQFPNITYVSADMDRLESIVDAIGPAEYIFHVAGTVASKTKSDFFRGNQILTQKIVGAALFLHSRIRRFVYISSLAAVGPGGEDLKPVDETTPCNPITIYGVSKQFAELEVLHAASTLPITIIRPPAIYGPRDTAILDFFKTVKSGIIPLIGSDRKYVSLVHVKDLVRGIADAAVSENTIGEIYFLANMSAYSWEYIGSVAAQSFGTKAVKIHIPEKLVLHIAAFSEFISRFRKKPSVLNKEKGVDMIQKNWTCSSAKAARAFGFFCSISLAEGFEETVSWYRLMGWL